MSPARIRELRRAGVLDGTKDDIARIAFLDIYERARGHQRKKAPTAAAIRVEVVRSLDAGTAFLDYLQRRAASGRGA